MSTPNFALKNASRYFVCRTPQYYTQEYVDECELDQDLVGEYDEDLTIFCYQNSKDNVASELKANGWHDIEECDGERCYPTTLFSEKTVSIMCGDNPIDITIQAGCTSGYYEAANFDWFVNIKTYRKVDYYYETCDYDYNDLTADDVIRDDWYENRGLSKIHAAHIIRKIEAIIGELKNEAELAFSKYSDEEMYCAYQCCNGEAGYNTAGKRLYKEVEEQNKKTA